MAHAKGCPYCHGTHRKLSAFKRCARKYGPKQMWSKSMATPTRKS